MNVRFLVVCLLMLQSVAAETPGKLKDFRGTPQTLALLGASSEFVDPAQKDTILQLLRRQLNRYTRSYGEASIGGFKLAANTNDQFFRPVLGQAMGEQQKQFLKSASKDNSIDIIALCSLREVGDGATTEIELQLFDSRIEVISAVERAQVTKSQSKSLEDLAYRMMNYLDKDGFVHPSAQDLLEKPLSLVAAQAATAPGLVAGGPVQEFSVNPTDLSAGSLAGAPTIAGDKTPFWERWWFWALVGGGVATAGGLSYYFLVVNQDPNQASIRFKLP